MKSAQSNGGSAIQSTKEVESESFPSRKNLKPVSNSVVASAETSTLNSVVSTSASTSASVGDSSSSRRIELSTSGTTEISTDQSDNDTCAISLVQKKAVIADEDEAQASSETTSESTDDSFLSTGASSVDKFSTYEPAMYPYKTKIDVNALCTCLLYSSSVTYK